MRLRQYPNARVRRWPAVSSAGPSITAAYRLVGIYTRNIEKGVKGAKSKSVFQHPIGTHRGRSELRPWFDFCNNIRVVRRISPGSRLRADLRQMSASKPIGTEKGYCLGGLPARPRGCRLPTAIGSGARGAGPSLAALGERDEPGLNRAAQVNCH
jgi:hypothetical protein